MKINWNSILTNLLVIFVIVFVIMLFNVWGEQATIHILEFSDTYVSGSVSGITNPNDYKIVIYAKDSYGWVKQPHPGDREGFSWAAIRQDGSWSIGLRERFSQKMQFIKSYVVILINKGEYAPDRVKKIESLKYLTKENIL